MAAALEVWTGYQQSYRGVTPLQTQMAGAQVVGNSVGVLIGLAVGGLVGNLVGAAVGLAEGGASQSTHPRASPCHRQPMFAVGTPAAMSISDRQFFCLGSTSAQVVAVEHLHVQSP